MRRPVLDTLLAKLALAETCDEPCPCPICAAIDAGGLQPTWTFYDEFGETSVYAVDEPHDWPHH